MSRRVDAAAVGRILESAFLLRSARLSALPSGGASPAPPLSTTHANVENGQTESAVYSAQQYLRDSILHAVEIESTALPTTALAVVEDSTTRPTSSSAVPVEKSWQPRSEIGSVLEGRDLSRMDLSGTRLSASFNRSSLAEANLIGSYFAHCTFNSSVLSQADVSGAQFHSCTFMSADATRVKARRAHFSHCAFHRADLRDWDATGATFFQCSFTMSDMSRWYVDGQTTVIKPTDWGRCRRLDWRMKPGSGLRECRVVGDGGIVHALSLAPPEKSACRTSSFQH